MRGRPMDRLLKRLNSLTDLKFLMGKLAGKSLSIYLNH